MMREELIELLEHNTTTQGILAGSTHFNDLWARDALYASWGLLQHDIREPVNKTLRTLREHQKSDGQIPLRVGSTHIILPLLGMSSPQGAVYHNDKTSNPALDPNSLYIITLARRGSPYTKEEQHSIRQAANWLLTHCNEEGSPMEGPYASWDDSLKKTGTSIYNAALTYKALLDASNTLKQPLYQEAAKKLRKATNKLWTGSHFAAWTDNPVLDVAGNLLAIHTTLATTKQATNILQTLQEAKNAEHDTLPRTNYPHHKKNAVYTPFRLIGMADYHNHGPYWSWIAALEATIRENHGDTTHATTIKDRLTKVINNSNGVYEIYDEDGKPTNRLFYKSERDFSWTAGFLLIMDHPSTATNNQSSA